MTPAELKLAFENRIQVKEVDPLSEYKGKWGIYFVFTGAPSFLGFRRFETEQDAQKHIDNDMHFSLRGPNEGKRVGVKNLAFNCHDGTHRHGKDLLTAFPLPVRQ